jgi:hypothetical protein
MHNIMPIIFLMLGLLVLLTGIIYAVVLFGRYWLTGLLSRQRRLATVLQILVVIVIATPSLFLTGDRLKGRILGTFALTTTDPRELFGRFENSTSLEPVAFDFPDPERLRSPTVMPQMRLEIPRVYIKQTAALNSGNGIFSIGLNVVTTTFEPYRTGIQKLIADRLAAGLPAGLRKGETSKELNIVLVTDPTLSEDERQAELRNFVLSENDSAEACVQQAGPFPNSIEYRPRNPHSLSSSGCLKIYDGEGYFAVLIYRDGRIVHSVICRDIRNSCFAAGYRQTYWFYYLTFPRPEVVNTLDYMRRADELLSQFEIHPDPNS